MTTTTPERQWEEEAWVEVEIPAPTLPRQVLTLEQIEAKGFPCASARSAWRKAVTAGHRARLTYSIGPWMNARMDKILEEDCHTVALWAVKADGSRMNALWLRRTAAGGLKWTFESALLYDPPTLMNATEMKSWLS